jgi:SOS response associated peptidase (SRAP)
VPYWAKDIKVGFANINAKAEGIEDRPAFREAFQRRRYLVPLDDFYEWKKTPTGKQPYAIALADGCGRAVGELALLCGSKWTYCQGRSCSRRSVAASSEGKGSAEQSPSENRPLVMVAPIRRCLWSRCRSTSYSGRPSREILGSSSPEGGASVGLLAYVDGIEAESRPPSNTTEAADLRWPRPAEAVCRRARRFRSWRRHAAPSLSPRQFPGR